MTIELMYAKNGQPTLKVGDITLHSRYDPISEAKTLVNNFFSQIGNCDGIVIFGNALGYHTDVIANVFSGQIFVVETSAEIFNLFEKNCTKLRQDNVHYIVGQSPSVAKEQIAGICQNKGLNSELKQFKHPPSIRLNEAYFNELEHLFSLEQDSEIKGVRILAVSPVYGGSLPVWQGAVKAFRKLGNTVFELDNSNFKPIQNSIDSITVNRVHRKQLNSIAMTLMAESITAAALDRAVDLVFLTAQSPISSAVLNELKQRQIPVVYWFVEDYNVFSYWQELAPLMDYFFTIQKGLFHDYLKNIGVQKFKYLPLGADTDVMKKIKLTKNEADQYHSDVSHAGAGYRNRRKVLPLLKQFDFKLWGTEWEDALDLQNVWQKEQGRLTSEQIAKIYNASTININLHSSPFHNSINPNGDYLNPRTFDIAACGGFQLVDNRTCLSEHFENGKELVAFATEEELVSYTATYLNEAELRQSIAEQGYQRVLQEHTLEHRMDSMLKFVYSYEKNRAGQRHPNHINNLKKLSGNNPEIQKLIMNFEDDDIVTIDEVYEHIKSQSGELTSAEIAFLLMYEFKKWAHNEI